MSHATPGSTSNPGSTSFTDAHFASAALRHEARDALDSLESEITRIAGHINAIDWYFLKLLADFDESGGWCGDGIKSFAHWLNWKCGIGAVEAREKVRVARALQSLPEMNEAFRTGEVSYSKVRAMSRVATPDNEGYLLHIARYGTAAHVEKLVRSYRRCRQLNEDNDLADLYRSFGYYQDDDGMYVFRGRLPADEGELVVKALVRLQDEIWRERAAAKAAAIAQAKEEAQEREAAQAKEKAKSEAASAKNSGLQPENVSAETIFTETESDDSDRMPNQPPQDFSSTTASALVRLAEHYISTGKDGASTLSGSDKCQLLVHVNLNAANVDTQIEGGTALNFEDGGFLHPKLVRKLACDASIRAVGEDDAGNVISIGRKSRIIPRNMVIALKQRDRGCQYPNCHQHRWTDAHHIEHWADGGETSLDNLITLCRFHHTGLHRGDYRLEKTDRGALFLNKLGHEIKRVIPGPQHNPNDVIKAIESDHQEQALDITPSTAVTRWDGGGMEYNVAIEYLYRLDAKPNSPDAA